MSLRGAPSSVPESAGTLTRAVRAAIATHASALAIADDAQRLSYAELGDAIEGLAAAIRARVAPGDRVAVLATRGVGATVAFHAALAARAVAVPLPAGGPAARALAMLDDCDARLVVHDAAHARLAAALARPLLPFDDSKASCPPSGASDEPSPDDLAYILYTSGSTGRPKGVTWDHAAALPFPRWCISRFTLAPGDRVAAVAPLSFDLSTFDLFAALFAGASVLVPPHEALLFPRTLARWIAAHRPTVMYAVPTLWTQLLDAGADLSSLRAVLFAGEVFPVPALARLVAACPGASFDNLYGPTETNVCTAHRLEGPLDPAGPPLPIGHVLPHLSASSPEDELVIEGDAISCGYWGALDTARPRTHATGDHVERRADGAFLFRGRRDRMVKVRGYRVELGELEHAIAQHPSVRECAAVLDGERLCAYYVAEPDPGARALRAHCASRLPAYMIPATLIRLDALPRTTTGKVALSELAP